MSPSTRPHLDPATNIEEQIDTITPIAAITRLAVVELIS
jgi:hypothetical protein